MLKTFRIGGVHPPENKLSANRKIETIPLPAEVTVPLIQHIGAPAQLVVEKGSKVKVGTLLAEAGGFVSASIHSPVSGTVMKIDKVYDASGYKRDAIFIKVEEDIWEDSIDRSEHFSGECKNTPEEIIRKIAEAGIVGMGGATFPTHVKLVPPTGTVAEVLIINGAECEPYLTSDHALMLEKGREVLMGTSLLMKALKVDKAFIGIENNKKDAIQHLQGLSAGFPGIRIVPLKEKYPQGGEKQLIDAITGRQVASGALPVSVGAIVQNVGTVFAVYEAVQKNKPLIERVVTVTGKSVKNPGNYLARIGVSVSSLIDHAGGVPEDAGKIISGGPMMGKALIDISVPVTKGCSGILLMPEEISVRKEVRNCIRCSKCVNICPMGLIPSFLMDVSEYADWQKAEKFDITDCIECGSCTYTCPANRPLLDFIRIGKGKVLTIIRERKN